MFLTLVQRAGMNYKDSSVGIKEIDYLEKSPAVSAIHDIQSITTGVLGIRRSCSPHDHFGLFR